MSTDKTLNKTNNKWGTPSEFELIFEPEETPKKVRT